MTTITSLFDLTGKTVLVVGRGKVPHAIASLFREAGATLTHVEEVELTESAVAELFTPLAELDVLVNGAVRNGAWALEKLTLDEWDTVHHVNVRGAFLLMRQAVRAMKIHGRGGRLINISTIGSLNPVLHGNYAYGSSRAGTNALTRQFALDFAADGIQSNAILVGQVPSDAFPAGACAPAGPGVDPKRSLGGYGRPDDIAPTALLLATSAGRYINGQTIVVDGGYCVA
jgi:meso-butanediol dehydrogenase/(S,S)-butanediol dehydrogenase/diacetyl reductase